MVLLCVSSSSFHGSAIALVALLLLWEAAVSEASVNLADVPCGKTPRESRRFHARIMGGSPIQIQDFPHAVSLKKNGKHYCGGALVSERLKVFVSRAPDALRLQTLC